MGWLNNAIFGHFGVGISIFEGEKVRKKGKASLTPLVATDRWPAGLTKLINLGPFPLINKTEILILITLQ
jgi:hypothetical protein